jgi:hypothetical protein
LPHDRTVELLVGCRSRPGVTLFAASDKQAATPQDDVPVAYRLQSRARPNFTDF